MRIVPRLRREAGSQADSNRYGDRDRNRYGDRNRDRNRNRNRDGDSYGDSDAGPDSEREFE